MPRQAPALEHRGDRPAGRAGRHRRHHASGGGELHRVRRAGDRPDRRARGSGCRPSVERLLVGFMGCYAAVAALRSARHIVRSEPGARVLVVCVELCSLHLQDTAEIEPLLAMLQFGDGAAAALVTSDPAGFALDAPFATTLARFGRADPLGHHRPRLRDAFVGRSARADRRGARRSRFRRGRARRARAPRRSTAGRCMPAGARSSTRSRAAYHLPQGALWASRETLARQRQHVVGDVDVRAGEDARRAAGRAWRRAGVRAGAGGRRIRVPERGVSLRDARHRRGADGRRRSRRGDLCRGGRRSRQGQRRDDGARGRP